MPVQTKRVALSAAVTGALGTMLSFATLATLPVRYAQAAAATCAAAWSASTAYVGGNVASENGVNYAAKIGRASCRERV